MHIIYGHLEHLKESIVYTRRLEYVVRLIHSKIKLEITVHISSNADKALF